MWTATTPTASERRRAAHRAHYVPQQYLPSEMQGTYFYEPGEAGYEKAIQERLASWRERDAEEDLQKRIRRYGQDEGAAR